MKATGALWPVSGWYGTDVETFVVSRGGAVWCVQYEPTAGRNGEPIRVERLPNGAIPLTDDACLDLDVPAKCWE